MVSVGVTGIQFLAGIFGKISGMFPGGSGVIRQEQAGKSPVNFLRKTASTKSS